VRDCSFSFFSSMGFTQIYGQLDLRAYPSAAPTPNRHTQDGNASTHHRFHGQVAVFGVGLASHQQLLELRPTPSSSAG
jgi:hypothetical protein